MTRVRPGAALALLPILGAAALGGCSTDHPRGAPPPLTPTEQYSVIVRPVTDEIQLAANGGLSANQQAALAALVSRWRQTGDSPIVVQGAASGPGGDTAQAAVSALQAHGVPAQAIRMAPFESAEPVPVRVGFSRQEAVGPQCSTLWGNLTGAASNRPAMNFGCSTTANFAAQIADPRDLVHAAPVDPADSRRRVLKANSYREGDEPVEDTSSAGAQ